MTDPTEPNPVTADPVAPDPATPDPATTGAGAGGVSTAGDGSPAKWATWLISGLVGLIVLLFAAVIVRPFDVPEDPNADSVATAWNTTIGRLGIISVYPPTEDFSVGDIWAVVADSDDTPLLGKGMRLWRIDMRGKILEGAVSPVFADSSEMPANTPDGSDSTEAPASGVSAAAAKKPRVRSRMEVRVDNPDKLIPLTLTAFPGVTISHVRKSSAAAGTMSGWFGVGSDRQEQEDIQIKGVETYGVSSLDAIAVIKQFCRAETTKLFCRDDYIRNALAFAVDRRVLNTNDGKKFTTRINLQLVTRVFMTREISQRRYAINAGGGAAQVQADPSKAQTSDTPATASAATDTESAKRVAAALDALNKSLASSGAQGARISLARSDGQEIGLNETFPRPLIFGYRAVSLALEPSQPQAKVLQ